MTKTIVAALLGFLTIPMMGFAILGVVVSIKFATAVVVGYGMDPSHYWAGFFLLIGLMILFGSSLPFWA